MSHLAYYRVSGPDQSIESQRHALVSATGANAFDEEFVDAGISGAVPAAQRPGFSKLAAYCRKGDTIHVFAVDRLGRDALEDRKSVV